MAVIPAKAGIQPAWTPAYAGVTTTGISIPMGGPQAHGALINPSDLMFARGLYGFKLKKLPVVPGFEGSVTVVAAGSGLLA